jgi:hypothetical protein
MRSSRKRLQTSHQKNDQLSLPGKEFHGIIYGKKVDGETMKIQKSVRVISAVVSIAALIGMQSYAAEASLPTTPHSKIQINSSYSSELRAYKTQLSKLVKAETEIINGWSSVSGANYTTDDVMYSKLQMLLPKVNAFVARVEAIQPNNSKIYAAHRLYIDGWNYQYQGFTMVMAALENQDYAQMTQANSYLSKGRAKITAFSRTLKTL